ncbi:hypothetical protein B0A52_03712 [Exophiala mesophila]|uniref:Uncharacterized protein n=1 Tax=Exophiala mesophila TaxID=212818 RepID=A0A438N9S6_EXOME|nr:hypothetical protein B0A52_03712 [Exophiala mesophila]
MKTISECPAGYVPGIGTEDDLSMSAEAVDEQKSEFDRQLEEWRQDAENDSSKNCFPATTPESIPACLTKFTSTQSIEKADFFMYMSQAGFPPVDTRLQPWKKVRPKTKTRAESDGKMVVRCSGIHYYNTTGG